MRADLVLLFGLGVATLSFAGCSSPSGGCAHQIASGNYADPYAANSKRLLVDRQAGTVTVAYARDGKSVVETWRILP